MPLARSTASRRTPGTGAGGVRPGSSAMRRRPGAEPESPEPVSPDSVVSPDIAELLQQRVQDGPQTVQPIGRPASPGTPRRGADVTVVQQGASVDRLALELLRHRRRL